MSKKLFILTSFVLVLSPALVNIARGVDPGLVGWWKFDEIAGNIAYDSSGNGNDGKFTSNPQWVPGKINGALEFDGTDDNVYAASVQLSPNAFTLAFWFNSNSALDSSNARQEFIYWESGSRPHVTFNRGVRGEIAIHCDVGAEFAVESQTTSWAADTWYHIAGTFDGTDFKIYLNGDLENVVNRPGTHTDATGLLIGSRTSQRHCFGGKIDDVHLYSRALTEKEIQQVMKVILPGAASNPNPADEATDVPRDAVLSWTPGEFAPPVNGHKVYISENFNDVNDGIGGIAKDANSYAPPQRLDFGTTYYWRVDEVNGPTDYTLYEGEVWSFTTEPVGYPIENVTATASSQAANRGPENAVNGSGLDESGLLHGKEGDDNMWVSDITGPQPTWIEFEFDKVYKLHELWVWNANDSLESMIGFGFKDVTIEYSANGTDYTTLGTTHQFARAPGMPDYAHNTTIDFGGVLAKYVRLTANNNWGSILPQSGLSEVRFFYIPVWAREPRPADGETDVSIGTVDKPIDVTFGFRAGREAAKHDVYFNTDEQAVAGGTAGVISVTESSYGPLSLDLGKIYYWRVDEVNEAETTNMWQGDLWDFTTQEYFVVDDFESYNDLNTEDPASNRIFQAWLDGYGIPTNGSVVGYESPPFCEQTIIHGGKQSMPLAYSNTGGAAYSEAERTFAVGQNWTQAGAATLVLYFHGAEGNTGQLYVKVDGSKVVYDGDAGDIAKVEWKQWNIDLASLGAGVQNVTKLSIGVDGNGASGTLYFDDIRLYRLAPEPEAP